MLADPLLWRQNLDELPELFGNDAPSHPDVAVEGKRLVLGGNEDAPEAGIDAVAEREIDDSVRAAEEDGRLGAVARQWIQALARTSGEENDQRIVDHA